MQAAQPEIRADPGFGLFNDIETEEDLAVSLGIELRQDLARDVGAFLGEQAFQLARRRV